MIDLPIDSSRSSISGALEKPGLTIVKAPPGTGKSTRVPQFLASEKRRIICIEPRRIAARSLAYRVATETGCDPGGYVGYRVRFDKKVSAETRIEFVSRGVFLRQILQNPRSLGDYHAILIDEFHERQIETDWIFGLLVAQQKSTPSLRVGILSATLETEPIQRLWGEARIIEIESPLYPVEISHSPRPTQFDPKTVAERATQAVLDQVTANAPPDYLVFLPGYREIRRTLQLLRENPRMKGWDVLPLSGEQPPEEQDRAIRKGPRPRVVVATNLAESSLTVEGVRVVIDSGLVRRMDHEPARGINALRTVRVSLFSARQRTGRAGRIDVGKSIRLWSQKEEATLSTEDLPECQRLDLAEWYLQTMASRRISPDTFPWLDPPPQENILHARNLLDQLGAIAGDQVTSHGEELRKLPLHPRLGAIILEGRRCGLATSAALLVALIEEGRLLIPDSPAEERFAHRRDDSDLEGDLRLLASILDGYSPKQGDGVRIGAARQALQHARNLQQNLPPDETDGLDLSRLRQCCLAGFPDRIARRIDRGTTSYLCRDGTTAKLDRHTRIEGSEWILALEKKELMIRGTKTSVLCSPINLEEEWIKNLPPAFYQIERGIFEDPSGRLLVQEIRSLDAIEIDRQTFGEANESERASHFASEALRGNIPLRFWNPAVEKWINRVECLRLHFPELEIPIFDQEAKKTVLEMVALETKTVKEFRNTEILPTLREWLSPEFLGMIDEMIPENFPVPNRKRPLPIDFDHPESPRISLRIQEAMTIKDHPTIASGRCRLTVELLAPNHRPVQITNDLEAFWTSSYASIRKDLRGRYPKHNWPEL